MRYYEDFKYPDASDEGFPGDPTTVAESLGEAVMAFEELDEQLSTSIAFLLRRGDTVGQIMTAEMSFKAKVNLFVVLFMHEAPKTESAERLRELAGVCGKAEEVRNQLIHSKWRRQLDSSAMARGKFTARAKHGLRHQSQVLTPVQVQAITHHCFYLAHCVDDLMYLEFGREYGEP
jgi:hypothetical protein